ncbi:MAG: amidohydrolase family protein [Piscinibacter sp.]
MKATVERIDAHQHFWRLSRGDYRWLRADVPALAPIHRDVGPDELQPLLARHGVVRTVLVQAADSEAETDFMLSLAREQSFIGGVVGWVDLTRIESIATLQRWATEPAFKGVRPMLQDLPEADWIATRPHPEVMRAVQSLGLRFDALVQPWHLEPLLRFVDAWPELPVMIDHAAKPQLAQGWSAGWVDAWRHGIAALARRPQVMCKVSGLLTEAAGAARGAGAAGLDALLPVWQALLGHFGAQRLVWGSDWPVLNLAADYERWVSLSEQLFAGLSDSERRAVWHDNAARFYAL